MKVDRSEELYIGWPPVPLLMEARLEDPKVRISV